MITATELQQFSEIFSEDVFPFYKQHEETFDKDGIHGVLHIGRSLIASYILCKKSNEFGRPANIMNVLLATAFHDSARQSGGMDYWESFSAQNCANYIKSKKFSGIILTDSLENEVGNLIMKKKWLPNNVTSELQLEHPYVNDFMCVHDSDVLEIMRPSCGRGGRNSFNQERLLLYVNEFKFYSLYGKLINEWNEFILHTEDMKKELSTPDCIDKLIDIINSFPKKFSIIHSSINN